MGRIEPLLIDCHSDAMIDVHRRRSLGEERVVERVHLPNLRRGGVGASFWTVGGDPACLCPLGVERPFESALRLLETLRDDIAPSGDVVRIAGSAQEVRDSAEAGAFAIVPVLEGASPLRGDLDRIGQFHELGVRAVGLTWNTRNELAVGLGVDGEAGLTEVGRAAIGEMNRIGVIVDVSHAAPETFWDVVEEARAPFIASHANARSVRDHPRNLDDKQLEAIRDAGGLVGIVLYPAFVAGPPVKLEHVLDQAEALVEKLGIDCVGIGADFIDYAIEETIAELVEHGIPYSDSEFDYPQGVETCGSLSNLLEGLASRGYSQADIRKIAGENALRVLDDVERAAAT
jgi:membrane dipeptidase